MAFILWILLFLGAGYGAYRAIRGGCERSQSERLTGYGILGGAVLLLVVLSLAAHLFG